MEKVIALMNRATGCFFVKWKPRTVLLESLSYISSVYCNETENVGFGGMSTNATSASDVIIHLLGKHNNCIMQIPMSFIIHENLLIDSTNIWGEKLRTGKREVCNSRQLFYLGKKRSYFHSKKTVGGKIDFC